MIQRRAMLAAPFILPSLAAAQGTWPQRPVRVIVPFAAGGGTDLTARAVMDAIGTRLNRPVVVENRPGADGAIGTEAVARSAPDGHTLISLNPTHLILRHTKPDLPYDPTGDLTPVAISALYAFVLLASSEAPFRDIPGLIAGAAVIAAAGSAHAFTAAEHLHLVGADLGGVLFLALCVGPLAGAQAAFHVNL